MKWIQWGLDNLWTVIIVGTVLLQMIQAVFKKKGGGTTATEEQPKEFEFEDPELAERTRRIREEIQRKIEQRARGYTEAPSQAEIETPPPIIREVRVERPVAASQASSRVEVERQAEILEQQAVWEEKLREAKRMKASIEKRTAFESSTTDRAGASLSATRQRVVDDLRSPEALRRAFILREVLGPPVALRK
jgi:hypothetical protein